jgi:hypothetical protein
MGLIPKVEDPACPSRHSILFDWQDQRDRLLIALR